MSTENSTTSEVSTNADTTFQSQATQTLSTKTELQPTTEYIDTTESVATSTESSSSSENPTTVTDSETVSQTTDGYSTTFTDTITTSTTLKEMDSSVLTTEATTNSGLSSTISTEMSEYDVETTTDLSASVPSEQTPCETESTTNGETSETINIITATNSPLTLVPDNQVTDTASTTTATSKTTTLDYTTEPVTDSEVTTSEYTSSTINDSLDISTAQPNDTDSSVSDLTLPDNVTTEESFTFESTTQSIPSTYKTEVTFETENNTSTSGYDNDQSVTSRDICLEPNGFYPNPDDCSTFFQCKKGIGKLSECIADEHFSPTELACQDPCSAKCDLTLDCENSTSSSEVHTQSKATDEPYSTTVFELTTTDITTDGLTSGTEPTISTTDSETASASNINSDSTTETSEMSASTSNMTTMSYKSTTMSSDLSSLTTDLTGDLSTLTTDLSASTTDLTEESTTMTSDLSTSTTDESTATTSDLSASTTYEPTTMTSDLSESTTHEPTTSDLSASTTDLTNESTTTTLDLSSTTSELTTESTILSSTISTTVASTSEGQDWSTSDLTTVLTTAGFECMDNENTYPYVGDCKKFYLCLNGTPQEMTCDNRKHFSPLTLQCEDPCLAQCETSIDCSTSTKPPYSSPLPITVCEQRDLFPKWMDCTSYVDCTQGLARKRTCPRGLGFNPTTRVCDYVENAGCGKLPGPITNPVSNIHCPCESCLLPSNHHCSSYYLCLNNTAYDMQCSPGLLYDRTINTCNYANNVNCPTTTTTTARSTTARPNSRCRSADGMFPNPASCRSFVHCSNWRPFLKQCPGRLHFSVATGRCEYPCDAECDPTLKCTNKHSTSTTMSSTDRLPISTFDPVCTCRDCRLPDHESCTKYIECSHGRPTYKSCPRGQTFDRKRNHCDWAYRVDCRESDICPRRNGIFPFKADCHKFVHCANGVPYVMNCPPGLVFDAEKLRCEWSYNEECGGNRLPAPHSTTLNPIKTKFQCPSNFGYFRDETDCSRYYQCEAGNHDIRQCPSGLMFNSKHLTCDKPQNVKCDRDQHHQRRTCRRFDRQIRCPANRTHLAHSHCDMFYDCTVGQACPRRCPDGLFFNEILATCDFPMNVDCKKSDGTQYSLKNFSALCRDQDAHMQDPANKSCYYKCHRSKVLRGCCGKNRIFDHKRGQCRWRH